MDCIIFLFDQVSSWPSAVQVYFKPLNANCHKIRGEGMECSLRGLQNEWLRRPWPWFDEEPGSGSKQVCSLVGADPSIRGSISSEDMEMQYSKGNNEEFGRVQGGIIVFRFWVQIH
ncbi:unnamed protein product [Effrenium voratum]|nr:unnamed protein product [Effrenium voratum]CAJ1344111.1 unnamed protein product [Effrenium voratum]